MSMAIFHSKLLVITRGFGDDTIPSTFIGDVFLIVFNYPLTIVGLSTISTSYIQYISSYIHYQFSLQMTMITIREREFLNSTN